MMIPRPVLVLLTGLVLLSMSTACGEADPALEPGVAASTTVVAVPTPTIDLASDQLAQRALQFTQERINIKSGQPQVVLSLPVTQDGLNNLGFGSWTFEPGCVIPFQVVIVKGDFDVRPAMPASIPADQEIPAKYIVYIYDVRIGEHFTMISDPTGAGVKHLLGDPTLPDPDPADRDESRRGLPIPCDPTPVDAPGATEEDLTKLPTPVGPRAPDGPGGAATPQP